MNLIQTGLGIASGILGFCEEAKAQAIVDVIANALWPEA